MIVNKVLTLPDSDFKKNWTGAVEGDDSDFKKLDRGWQGGFDPPTHPYAADSMLNIYPLNVRRNMINIGVGGGSIEKKTLADPCPIFLVTIR